MTTYAGFVAIVAGATITGVTTKLDYIPAAGYTGNLPLSFPRFPGGGINPETLTTCTGDGKTMTMELVVVLEPLGQGNPEPNYEATIAMMDYVEAGLGALGDFMPIVEYQIRAEGITLGGVGHWGVVATVTGTE